jgi:hypothetical protein
VVHVVIQIHKRLKQEDHEFKTKLDYIVSPCLKKEFENFCLGVSAYS